MFPSQIRTFFYTTFEAYEIRDRVGNNNNIKFYIYSNDHNPPHVHAIFNEYHILINLKTFKVDGNIPCKNKKIAVEWVKENIDKLNNDWNNINISSNYPLINSRLLSANKK